MSLINDVWTNRHTPFRSTNAASAIKELREIVFALTIFSAIMTVLAALDIWIWVPHLNW
jgi:hypothetical protein